MIRPPNEPSGSGSAASWLRDLLRFSKSLRVKDSPHIQVSHTTDGVTLALRRVAGGGGGGGTIAQFKISTVNPPILRCHRVDDGGVADTSELIAVGMPPEFSRSFRADPGETVAELAPLQRTVMRESGAALVWVEEIKPVYLAGDFILAARINQNSVVTPSEWTDLNIGGRRWRMQVRPVKICMPDQSLADQAFHAGKLPGEL